MSQRYLFGPVTRAFAEQNLYQEREAGNCLAFGLTDGPDLTIGLSDAWEDMSARLPSGWLPDFVVLYLPYERIPRFLWSAPVPLVALAAYWNLLWHHYRHCLGRSDLVLTDEAGVEVMAREGIGHARAANLFGCERAVSDQPSAVSQTGSERDIDVLFVGNLDVAVQRERLAWVARLAGLGGRRRVAIHSHVYGEEYRRLLGRARIVFNRSIRGECNRRTFEAAAAGALLFQEAGNRKVPCAGATWSFITPATRTRHCAAASSTATCGC
jgi:hypothetical protein